jgi:hypothetical protein
MLTSDTPPLRQTGSRNLTGLKTLPTIWHTYMKLVIKYQIPVINSCLEKCDEKWAYMFNMYKNQQSRQTGSRNLTSPKTLPTRSVYVNLKGQWTNLYWLCLLFICGMLCKFKYRTVVVYICYTPAPRRGRGVYCFTSVRPFVRPRFISSHFSQ